MWHKSIHLTTGTFRDPGPHIITHGEMSLPLQLHFHQQINTLSDGLAHVMAVFKMKFNILLLPLETSPSYPVPANATSWSGRMPCVIISCITAFFVNAGNETSGMIIPRVNTHQHIYASSNQLHFSYSLVVLSFPSLLPPPLIKDTHGYPKAAKPFYQNYSPLVTRPRKAETHTTLSATTLLWLIVF